MSDPPGAKPAATRDRSRPRQAVVLIHGIGEQRPMETLRNFVGAMLKKGSYYSKPDEISGSYELRRLKLRRVVGGGEDPVNARWPETDFYEYYWAHQMYGTLMSHIVSWLGITMWRGRAALFSKDRRYHPRLRWLVPIAWVLTIVAGCCVIAYSGMTVAAARLHMPTEEREITAGLALLLALTVVWKLIRGLLLAAVTDAIGDAARYFNVNPKNVARRYDILRGGVDMLRKLSEDCDRQGDIVMFRYGRIVLIGHSLGSVIAYDILKHYFIELNSRIPIDTRAFESTENFQGNRNGKPDFPGARPYSEPKAYRRQQDEMWRAYNASTPAGTLLMPRGSATHRWIVSDLVTMGSPLAYAPILLATDVKDLNEKIMLRELPTCPPDRSRHLNRGRFTIDIASEAERIVQYHILQHHAFFAMTRWTNFFFRSDPIGGPLEGIFGNGIEDVALEGHSFLFSHVSYWKRRGQGSRQCLAHVRRILTKRVFPLPSSSRS